MAERLPFDISLAELGKYGGGESLDDLMRKLQAMNVRPWDDNFYGGTIRAEYGTKTGDNGTFSIESNDDHAKLAASTGSGLTGEYCSAFLAGLAFKAENFAVTIARIAPTLSVDTAKYEFGFIDSVGTNGIVNSLAAETYLTSDAAAWVYDTNDSGALYWQNVAVKDGNGITKLEPEILPVANTYEYLGVALLDTNAKFLRWNASGKLTYESPWQADAITADDPLTPFLFVQLRGSVDRNIQIQKWMAWQNFTSS